MSQLEFTTVSEPAANSQSEIELGRNLLADWEAAQPDNFFAVDVGFQRSLEFLWGREAYSQAAPSLYHFGRQLASETDALVREGNLDLNLPRLDRFDALGGRVEEVVFHPSYHDVGRTIYGSGMLADYAQAGNNLLSLAKFYLSSQLGEAGHNCPVACTAGMIKVLQNVAAPDLRERYLPALLDKRYDSLLHGAQFLTEVQGGSDVGANGTVATRANSEAGNWLLNGEKWFCSNITADLALVTARVPGQGEGTRGLGLFLVPRRLADGRPNGIHIRRLKDKLGTRSMATGEIDFVDTLAYQVGPLEQGFKNVMTHVINTSRVYNAVGVCGNARRAYLVASGYAHYRRAFGQPIIHFPLVQDQLANMRAGCSAMLAGTLRIISTIDALELGEAGPAADGFLRMAINLNKYRSAVLAHEIILTAIELLGGNGAIETFSVLPRLLRDNVVYENWEGTHNVLMAQVQRDMRRYAIHEPFLVALKGILADETDEAFKGEAEAKAAEFEAEIAEVLAMDELTAAIYFRPLMNRLTDLYYAACLAAEGRWEKEEKRETGKSRLSALYFGRRVQGKEPKDIPYYDDLVSRLCVP